jgi:hypothetical protein
MPWRIVELPEGMTRTRYQTITRLFPTQESAAAHRASALDDPNGELFALIETEDR